MSLAGLISGPDEAAKWNVLVVLAHMSTWPEEIGHKITSQVYCPLSFKDSSTNWLFDKLTERDEFHSNFLLRGLANPLLSILLVRISKRHVV